MNPSLLTTSFRTTIVGAVLCVFIIGFVIVPVSAYAQQSTAQPNNPVGEYTLLEPLPCLGDGTSDCTEGQVVEKVKFETYIQYIFNLAIALSAVAAVLVIVWGGFQYITSDSFRGKDEGKKTIWKAVQGLLLVLCSYLILRTIDPRLVAIPSTIVAPLDIQYERGATSSFFTELANEASKYRASDQAAIAAREVAKRQSEEYTKKLQEVDQQLGAIYSGDVDATDVEIQRLTRERAILLDQLNGTLSEASIQNAIAIYNSRLNNTVDPNNPITLDTIEKYLKDIDTVDSKTEDRLNKTLNNNTEAQKELYQNMEYFVEARILTKKYDSFTSSLDGRNLDAAKAELEKLKTTHVAKITDEKMRTEIETLVDKTIADIQLRSQIKSDTDGYEITY